MSSRAAAVLGLGLGVLLGAPLVAVVVTFTADRIADWHYGKSGLREWARRDWRKP